MEESLGCCFSWHTRKGLVAAHAVICGSCMWRETMWMLLPSVLCSDRPSNDLHCINCINSVRPGIKWVIRLDYYICMPVSVIQPKYQRCAYKSRVRHIYEKLTGKHICNGLCHHLEYVVSFAIKQIAHSSLPLVLKRKPISCTSPLKLSLQNQYCDYSMALGISCEECNRSLT